MRFIKYLVFILLSLILVACSSWQVQDTASNTSRTFSEVDFKQIDTIIRLLPKALQTEFNKQSTLLLPELKEIVSGFNLAIDSEPAKIKLLQQRILFLLFKHDAENLNLFCEEGRCKNSREKQIWLKEKLRGSFLSHQNLIEDYAFYATEYFVDTKFGCKHPFIVKVLEQVWESRPVSYQCNKLVPFLVSEGGKASKIQWIDPDKIYSIHLLYAGAKGFSVSSFGHLELRLIVCNQDRLIVDAQCEDDLFDHISLGFKASIDEVSLSLWKGVFGGYPIKLYGKSFVDTYREYSIDEFRDLYSLPLILKNEDKTFFIKALSEIHWSYTNDYKFFSSNCGTELAWLINSIFKAQDNSIQPPFDVEYFRPDALFGLAKQSASFKGEVFDDLSLAEKNGFYFPNTERYYQIAIDTLAKQAPEIQEFAHSPKEWVDTNAMFRSNYWLGPIKNKLLSENKLMQAAVVLEGLVARKLEREVISTIVEYYKDIMSALLDNKFSLTEVEYSSIQKCANQVKVSFSVGISSDGIPQDNDVSDTTSQCDINNIEFIRGMKKIIGFFPITDEQKSNIIELEITYKNILMLNSRF